MARGEIVLDFVIVPDGVRRDTREKSLQVLIGTNLAVLHPIVRKRHLEPVAWTVGVYGVAQMNEEIRLPLEHMIEDRERLVARVRVTGKRKREIAVGFWCSAERARREIGVAWFACGVGDAIAILRSGAQ